MVETQLYEAAWLVVNVCSRQQLRENEGPGQAWNNDLSSLVWKSCCFGLCVYLLIHYIFQISVMLLWERRRSLGLFVLWMRLEKLEGSVRGEAVC